MIWTRSLFFLSVSFSLSAAAHFGSSGRRFATAAVTPHRARAVPLPVPVTYKSSTDEILKLRGGAGPLDPSIVVKAASVIAGIQALLMQFAPVDTAISYGLDEEGSKKPMNVLATSYAGTAMLASAITSAYLGFVDNATVKGAFTVCLITWVYENLRNLFGKSFQKAGADSNVIKNYLVVELLGLYGMTREYWGTVLKVLGVFFSLSGLHLSLDPAGASKLWNKYEETDDIGKAMMRCFGSAILAQSLVFVAMSFLDYDGLKAVGLGSVSWFIYHIYGIVSGMDDKLGVPRKPMLFWLAYHATIMYTTLF